MRPYPRGLGSLAAACLGAVLLAACNTRAAAPPAAAPASAQGVTPSSFRLPDGSGCSGEVARFRAILRNDVEVGHLTESVYGRASADLDRAAQACAAGRDGDARAQVVATRRRYGYP